MMLVNPSRRTGMGAPSATNEPPIEGVVARLGILMLPAFGPNLSEVPSAASRGKTLGGLALEPPAKESRDDTMVAQSLWGRPCQNPAH